MQDNARFKEYLLELSISELEKVEWRLEAQLLKAKHNSSKDDKLISSLEHKLLMVKNQITALKIRN